MLNSDNAILAKARRFMPILDWGRSYNRDMATNDLVAAVIVTIMLIPQSLKDPLRGVPLLAMRLLICRQDLLDHRQERIQLRGSTRRSPVTRRLRMRQHFLQRLPVQAVLRTRLPLTDLARQHATANLRPLLHVREHPSLAV